MQAGQDSDGWVVGLEGLCTLHAVIMLCNVFVTWLPDRTVPVGLLGPPIHNMGPCGRAGEANAWKRFRAQAGIEPR